MNPIQPAADSSPLMVILNPAASGGRGHRLRSAVERGLQVRGIPYSLEQTAAPGHAGELAAEAAAVGVPRILVVGGDGTIHEVVNGILASGGPVPVLAIVPTGTGNDFFRMVGASWDVDSALDLLIHGRVARLDVGRALISGGQVHFVNLVGVGLDVEVLRRRSGFRSMSGLPQYLCSLVAALFSFKTIPLDVTFEGDGEILGGSTILAGATVGPSVGGGFLINPDASPHDGLLDLFFVEPLGPGRIVRYIPKVLRGTHGQVAEFHSRTVSRARFSRADGEPFYFELDGELMPEPVVTLEFEVCPNVIPVLLSGRGA